MQLIAYYEKKKETLLGFFPTNADPSLLERVQTYWNQPVAKAILKILSRDETSTAPEIKQEVGHSMSTLHENIAKLERDGLLTTQMVYSGNKKKVLKPEVLFVTKNSTLTSAITRFLNQGLLVDSKTGSQIVEFLHKNKDRSFTADQISARTGIQVDEVETLLDNWDSIITRSFSEAFKQKPFVKRITYQSIKGKNIDLKM